MSFANEIPVGTGRFAARLADYRRLFSGPRFDPQAYFTSYPAWLPFRLGESQAEASVPYALSGELVEALQAAGADLVELLRRRKEGEPRREVQISFEEAPRKVPPFRPYPGRLAEGTFLHAVIDRALRLDPALDAGLMEAWLGRGAPANRLVERAHALASQALEVDLAAGCTTPYLYLCALVLADQVEGLKRLPKAVQIRNYSYDRLEKAFGLAFFAAFATVIERLLESLPGRGLPFETESYALRARLALDPLAYVSIRKSVLINDANPYGVTQRLASVLEPAYGELLEQDPDPRGIERRLLHLLVHDPALGAAAAEEGDLAALRESVRGFLARFDAFDEDLTGLLVPALSRDDELPKLRENARNLTALTNPLTARRLSEPEAAALRAFRAALRGGGTREGLLRTAAQNFLALALDRFAAEHLDAARARLRNRRAEFPEERLEGEWSQGKLYRLAGDGRPFLRAATRASQGHLFIDLKGFTQRTYRAKEVVMAEFLRTEFYGPIVRAAARHAAPLPEGGPALTLQNLLGDAAVFSGDVRVLVKLAREIQHILAGYAEKLRARMGGVAQEAQAKQKSVQAEADERALRLRTEGAMLDAELARKRRLPAEQQEEVLWDMYARRLFQLEKRRTEAELAGLGAEVERLRRAEDLLRQERAAVEGALDVLTGDDRRAHIDERVCAPERARKGEVARELAALQESTRVALRALEEEARSASGFGLEAGLFVTYGAAAEIVELDEAPFGHVKVAIAEKINEAARGTARSSHIKAKLDAQLERARARNPQLELPFNVYVDQTYNAVLAPEVAALVDQALAQRDEGLAREAGRLLAESLARDVARLGQKAAEGGAGIAVLNDIYNVGEAFSVEAVEAYVRDTRGVRFTFKKGLAVAELHPEFRERFCFVHDALELWISVPPSNELADAVVFRQAGHVHFRGFEAKRATAVYELVRRESAFSRLLAQHHLRAWIAEARAAARG